MGLFDGAADGTGATADIAALFGLPVLLVVDVTGMGASVAALIDGFRRHREDVEVIGVILNRVASPARRAFEPRLLRARLDARARHHTARCVAGPAQPASGPGSGSEHPDLPAFIEAAANLVEGRVDLDRLQRLARAPAFRSWGLIRGPGRPGPADGGGTGSGVRLRLQRRGAGRVGGGRGVEITPFSPLADEAPDAGADASSCPAAIPSFTRHRSPPTGRFLAGLREAARAVRSSMASAADT